ncbi:MAG: S8 family serine peptidase [Gemmatimonadales bacterium]
MTRRREPVLPPRVAFLAGLMPLESTGVDSFRLAHPTFDGRGVLIAILDSGIDPGLPGLKNTTTGQPKILDLRDFSGEGRVPLFEIQPERDGTLVVGGRRLSGFGRVARLARRPYYGGVFQELSLGGGPASDLNGNGSFTDGLPLVVARSSSGWFVVADTDGDSTLDDEFPVHDFLFAGETIAYDGGAAGAAATAAMSIAVNLSEDDEGHPILDLVMDNFGHGTHVAGIAAGHGLFGVEGFDGVAPGAQLLGLKISNNTRGGVSVTGAMLRAMNYAADFARRRGMPLVINLSFGVGHEIEGPAAIDSLVDEFVLKHLDVVFVVSAGNDGPGLSTVDFPASSEFVIAACALFPGAFSSRPEPDQPKMRDVLGWWSARGGEVAKPDLCTPGVAFSTVPAWRTGEEISGGTSMAAPQISGAAALLLSAMRRASRRARAIDVKRALMATAVPLEGATVVDQGAGVPNVPDAYRWLLASHQAGLYRVEALPDGGEGLGGRAAYRRRGLASDADTLQRFRITSVGGQPAARLLLEPDQPWLRAPAVIEPGGAPVTVEVTYDRALLVEPGLHVGTVWARPATDTMAGPAFGLVNTIVVSHDLAGGLDSGGDLPPGGHERYYLPVAESDGGLGVTLVSEQGGAGTLYLFEPSGQPHRRGSAREVGSGAGDSATIVVAAEDLVPGVYEAVVVAPPTQPLRYRLRAALPELVVTSIADGPRAVVRNRLRRAVEARITGALVGATQSLTVNGVRDVAQSLVVDAPSWASRLLVDVDLPVEIWLQLTDFGVTVFDSAGVKLRDGPMHYAFGRLELNLDSTDVAQPLTVELFPGFAHMEPPASWSARVTMSFLASEAIELERAEPGVSDTVAISAGAGAELFFSISGDRLSPPAAFDPLVEVRARGPGGTVALRRAAARARVADPPNQ